MHKIPYQELDQLRREKQELRVQYAREIEAAHAQLGLRESQMGNQHLKALQQLKDENAQGIMYSGYSSTGPFHDKYTLEQWPQYRGGLISGVQTRGSYSTS